LLALTSNAQSKITKNDLYDHWKVVSALQDSKDIKYQDYLALYNQQIALKPMMFNSRLSDAIILEVPMTQKMVTTPNTKNTINV
jgi:hypothetical protein